VLSGSSMGRKRLAQDALSGLVLRFVIGAVARLQNLHSPVQIRTAPPHFTRTTEVRARLHLQPQTDRAGTLPPCSLRD
jgi:hypothetical protein